MSISKINNQNKLHNRNFKSSAQDSAKKYSDSDLLFLASVEPNSRFYNVSKNFTKTIMFLPLVDTMSSFVNKSGSLAAKTKAAYLTSGIWLAAGLAAYSVNKIKKTLNSEYSSLAEFNKEHPASSTVIDFAAVFATMKGIMHIADSTKVFVSKKYPKLASKFTSSFVKPTIKVLNDSKINKKLVQPFETYKKLHPAVSKSIKIASSLAVPVILLAAGFRYFNEAKHRNQSIENNYALLKSINENITAEEV